MADLSTLQAWLTEAETAYHKLRTGSAAEEVEHGDMRTRYTRSLTGMQELSTYIESLKDQIRALGGTVTDLIRKSFSIDL